MVRKEIGENVVRGWVCIKNVTKFNFEKLKAYYRVENTNIRLDRPNSQMNFLFCIRSFCGTIDLVLKENEEFCELYHLLFEFYE